MNIYPDTPSQLLQDRHSSLIFGTQFQLTVVGHTRQGYVKSYVVECSICKADFEMYDQGLFITKLGDLKSGKMPCGCSRTPKWNLGQWLVLCKRFATKNNYLFNFNSVDFEFLGQKTCCELSCPTHGKWVSKFAYIAMGKGCKKCADSSGRSMKDDAVMIESFLSTGVFHPDTTFTRSNRKTTQGAKNYWYVSCPVCGVTGEANSSDLRKGNQPCICIHDQRHAYINIICDKQTPIAIKFGISKAYKSRVSKQNRKSVYEVSNLKAWEFPDKISCIKAELWCKQNLECGVLTPDEMPDGWSETTSLSNADKISSIFEGYGGTLMD